MAEPQTSCPAQPAPPPSRSPPPPLYRGHSLRLGSAGRSSCCALSSCPWRHLHGKVDCSRNGPGLLPACLPAAALACSGRREASSSIPLTLSHQGGWLTFSHHLCHWEAAAASLPPPLPSLHTALASSKSLPNLLITPLHWRGGGPPGNCGASCFCQRLRRPSVVAGALHMPERERGRPGGDLTFSCSNPRASHHGRPPSKTPVKGDLVP